MTMDVCAPTCESRKSLKPTKMCSLVNGLWLLTYVGRPTQKMLKRWSRKKVANIKFTPNQRETLREREREKERDFGLEASFWSISFVSA